MNLIILKVESSHLVPLHSKSMKEREWMLGDAIVNELYEYKNLGVLKSYVNSFASNAEGISKRHAKRLA